VLELECLFVGDHLARVTGHAAHRGDQARLGSPLDLVVRAVEADRLEQVIPLQLVGVRFRLLGGPDQRFLVADPLVREGRTP
jgi:hypothetical protein